MKSNSSTLKAFLLQATAYVYADLYTFTLPGGDVYWFTSTNLPITISGQTWAAAPCLSDNGCKQELGVTVDTLEIVVNADSRTTIGGVPLLDFIQANGLDSAVIVAQRAYFQYWGAACEGVIVRFSGRFSEARDGGATQVTVVVTSWTELLNTYMPYDIYQAQCLNTVYDTKCTLNRDSFKQTGAINATSTVRALATNLSAAAGLYNLGYVQFTSGANDGLKRTVTSQDGSGNLALVAPLPAVPAIGDTFNIYQGCDLAQGTCSSKFNNLINFRGAPYIPAPETSV